MMFTINILLTGQPVVTVRGMTALRAAWLLISVVVVLRPKRRGTARCLSQPQPNHYLPNQQTHGLTFSFWYSLFRECLCNERKCDTKLISICPLVFLQLLSVSV